MTDSLSLPEPSVPAARLSTLADAARPRTAGIDLARALAIIGMMAAHLVYSYGDTGSGAWSGEYWTSGYPSALFAVLAGVSTGFLMRGGWSSYPRLVRRAIILALLGAALSGMQHDIAIVLVPIAIELLAVGALTRWGTGRILAVLAILLTLGCLASSPSPFTFVLAGMYPPFAWIAYGVCGLLMYRYLIAIDQPAWLLAVLSGGGLGIGIAVALLGLRESFVGWTMYAPLEAGDTTPEDILGEQASLLDGTWLFYLSPHPHSGGLGDVVFSAAVSLGVISACLLLCRLRWAEVVTYPLRAFGAMSLTMYVAHVLTAGWFLMPAVNNATWGDASFEEQYADTMMPWEEYQEVVASVDSRDELWAIEDQWYEDNVESTMTEPGSADEEHTPIPAMAWWAFAGSVLVGVVFAVAWKQKFRRGPLEAALRWQISPEN